MEMTARQPMYENGVLGQATGGTLHPGGLDLTRRMLAWCGLPLSATILDVGCGSGETVEYLHGLGYTRAFGLDRSCLLAVEGETHCPGLPLTCAAGEALPLPGSRVDAILAECSLSAMGSSQPVLTEFGRVLRPGGLLALSDVYARYPAGLPALHALPFSCGLSKASTQDELAGRLQAGGFTLLVWEDHSEVMKTLTAQIIRSSGSLAAFWVRAEPGVDALDLLIAISRAKLGYYLAVARKV